GLGRAVVAPVVDDDHAQLLPGLRAERGDELGHPRPAVAGRHDDGDAHRTGAGVAGARSTARWRSTVMIRSQTERVDSRWAIKRTVMRPRSASSVDRTISSDSRSRAEVG